MPKKSNKLILMLDLLKPQSSPEKPYQKITKWLLSTGRYIIVFVELLVLLAFLSRFKFDADLESTKEAIDQQIPFIETQKSDEDLIRQTQLKLSTIKNYKTSNPDYAAILKELSSQIPAGIKLNNINLGKTPGKVNFKFSGTATSNQDLTTLFYGLKGDHFFSDITLNSVGLEQGLITFSLSGSSISKVSGEKNL